jgi:hypothetical protein
MAIKLKKTLYVGIGGTGVLTLLKVKKCFMDSYGEIPPMIGFLAIDTNGAVNSMEETCADGSTVKLEPGELLVCTVRGALNVYRNNPNTYDWVPAKNVNSLATIQGGGAGQIRSNGRFIAYYNNAKIKSNIQTAIARILQLIPHGSKYEVDVDSNGIEYPPNINVFASIAGGTGSGMLIDVLCIIQEAWKSHTGKVKLYPWIVLPDVFRTMNQGPAMENVYYNSYGALRTLDYIMHHDDKTPAINFGYAKIDESLFDYAYIINNINQAGVSFNQLKDIVDVVAKSAFLPANKMGDDVQSPFDNIANQKIACTYDILNKKGWAASASSAELIYDSFAVGKAYSYATVVQLCNSMLQSSTDGTADANRFFDDSEVLIRENEGKDDIINHLMPSPGPSYSLQIDENTSVVDINGYLDNNCGQTKMISSLQDALTNKLTNTERYFEKYLKEIMSRPSGKVDAAIKFIKALLDISSMCKDEMESEGAEFHKTNSVPVQWDYYLNAVKNTGIKSLLNKIDEDAVLALQMRLTEYVTNVNEETRRTWALKFYNSFDSYLEQRLQEVEGLKAILKQISALNSRLLLEIQHKAQSNSKFQVYLHGDDLMATSSYMIDDTIKNQFVQYLDNNGVSSWLGQSQSYIQNKLWNFAESTTSVKNALSTNIDSVLSQLPVETVQGYLQHLKILAAPLWTYNTQGFNDSEKTLDRFVVVGVGNSDTSILAQDPAYNTYFDTNEHTASFASTHQFDRIYVLIVEDLLPIYAVNNFSAYKRDAEEKVARNFGISNYLDEKLNNRMNAENFDMIPTIETDNVHQYWVWGFVFGYINFDVETNQYWIRSKRLGDVLQKCRYNLSHQRDVAFDNFKSERLYKDILDDLNKQIAKTGRQPFEEKINEIKGDDSYLESYAQLSPLERSNLNEPKFKAVRDLLEKEIRLMTD